MRGRTWGSRRDHGDHRGFGSGRRMHPRSQLRLPFPARSSMRAARAGRTRRAVAQEEGSRAPASRETDPRGLHIISRQLPGLLLWRRGNGPDAAALKIDRGRGYAHNAALADSRAFKPCTELRQAMAYLVGRNPADDHELARKPLRPHSTGLAHRKGRLPTAHHVNGQNRPAGEALRWHGAVVHENAAGHT